MKTYKLIYFFGTITSLLLVLGSCKKPDFNTEPPVGSIGTINNYLSNNFDLSLFAAAVKKVGLADSLDKTGSAFTVWAPNNAALNKEGILNVSDFDKWKPDSLLQFVKTHITRGKLFYNTIPQAGDNKYKNLNGDDLYLSNTYNIYFGQYFFIDGVFVQPTSTLGSTAALSFGSTQLNGVVYSITSSIKINHLSVRDFLASRSDLSILVAGLKKFGQWDKLDGNGPYTILAPQDSAFAKYDITADAISHMNPVAYDPVLFGSYYLTPNHLYLLDVAQYNRNTYVPFNTISPDFKVILTVNSLGSNNMSAALVKGVTNAGIEQVFGPGNLGSTFLHEQLPPNVYTIDYNHPPYGNYVNYNCLNGVVHLLSQPMVLPSEVIK